jgi:hypothetical protein
MTYSVVRQPKLMVTVRQNGMPCQDVVSPWLRQTKFLNPPRSPIWTAPTPTLPEKGRVTRVASGLKTCCAYPRIGKSSTFSLSLTYQNMGNATLLTKYYWSTVIFSLAAANTLCRPTA